SAICLRAVYWPTGDSTVVDSFTNCFIISSTSEAGAAQTLTLSPNPVQDMLYLQASQPLPSEAEVTVYDLHGRPVYRGAFAEAEKGIAAQSWPPGVYVLEVRDKSFQFSVFSVQFIRN
ncbi:T9SS type A sorting domain-containing protein, partial [Arthrospira platensis SPKY1]|nr:T9SS type A sorting domain-containing protein [Arthrospira platensis SPKY1]